ncbi:ArnT family glycosyltransferase [Picosynechococcus sp. PCC 73109]|uniref:ArnT family glycosyltransferase n=1 Tax=Picosynechococcus sp. PCC 73109 TaxID=374982 RepID=UPI0007457CD9|nr:phospholipid carrier-dependent glycosyltransferase [Picosynechococcus sp. PCC 73109]AMA08358.1 dolichyl-phosphate-mannose--protein mannosyltransferase [Picosynechococcus sp. PCC 73109]
MQDQVAKSPRAPWKTGLVLLGLWLGINLGDRLWLWLDQSVPSWDHADYLTESLNYVAAFRQFPGWENFWRLSNKIPPFTHFIAAPFQLIFGPGNDQALLMNLVFSGVLMLVVYGVGQRLFNRSVGLWSAAIALLMPRLTFPRLYYVTDFPLAAVTPLAFCCLTYWYFAQTRRAQWLWIIGFGISAGCALMTKQTALFFLFVPTGFSLAAQLWQKQWARVLQLLCGLLLSLPIWGIWYRTNFIYLFSTYERANVASAAREGDPPLNTLGAWVYYWLDLPQAIAWILLLVPLVGIALHLLRRFPTQNAKYQLPERQSLCWLGIYFGGAYLLLSAMYNKDGRYIMPYLPIVAVFLGYGLTQWRGKWQPVRWGTVGLAAIFWLIQLFPLPVIAGLVPDPNYPDRQTYPHPEIIQEIIQETPNLRSNLGVIPGVAIANNHTLNYYGALRDFQVYGRNLGSTPEQLAQDKESFDWFLTKTGEDPHRNADQLALAASLDTDSEFLLQGSWPLPDQDQLKLYHRRQPLVSVEAADTTQSPVALKNVAVASEAIAGQPLPITYTWSGNRQDLTKGMALLTWSNGEQFWIQDHQLAFGMLREDSENKGDHLEIIERTATLPPADLPAGLYTLDAQYLDPATGEARPLEQPTVTVEILPATGEALTPTQLVALDWLTQLRKIAPQLGGGIAGLEPLFAHVERLNQYDPVQDYLQQVEDSLAYRLTQTPANATNRPQLRDWYWARTLAHALQEESQATIETLTQLQQLTPDDPWVNAYIAFVHLYRWEPRQAELAITPVLDKLGDVPEIQAIAGVAALLQGKLFKAWSVVQTLKAQGVL